MFNGAIDGAGVYTRALTTPEITARYTAGPTTPPAGSGAVLYLPINENSGTATTDTVTGSSYPVRAGQWVPGRAGSALDFNPATLAEEVRIAHRGGQDFNSSVSGSFAHAIIRDIFGFQPDGATPTLANPTAARGTDGVLDNVAFGGHLYRITSDRSGLHVSRPDER